MIKYTVYYASQRGIETQVVTTGAPPLLPSVGDFFKVGDATYKVVKRTFESMGGNAMDIIVELKGAQGHD